jgi:hypothetical protein
MTEEEIYNENRKELLTHEIQRIRKEIYNKTKELHEELRQKEKELKKLLK